MQVVRAESPERDDRVTLPSVEALEGVRRLGERHPGARLRDVAVVRASELDARVDASGGTRVWIALEVLQVTGSFKVRGALAAIDAFTKKWRGRPEVITASAGNHGAGVAYAARVLGVRARIVVPRGAPRAKCDRMTQLGAELIFGPTEHYDDAEEEARRLAKAAGLPFLSAYDDPDVVAGNGGSVGFEIVRAIGGVPELVLAPFGGGGLATGLACAMALDGGERVGEVRRVWGVQSDVSPAMAQSLAAGSAVERLIPASPTLAEGLEGGISAAAFARARAAIAGVLVVSEASIARAMAHVYREMGLIIEGSAAVALAPVLEGLPPDLFEGQGDAPRDLVVVLTGRNVDRDRWESAVDA